MSIASRLSHLIAVASLLTIAHCSANRAEPAQSATIAPAGSASTDESPAEPEDDASSASIDAGEDAGNDAAVDPHVAYADLLPKIAGSPGCFLRDAQGAMLILSARGLALCAARPTRAIAFLQTEIERYEKSYAATSAGTTERQAILLPLASAYSEWECAEYSACLTTSSTTRSPAVEARARAALQRRDSLCSELKTGFPHAKRCL